MQSIIHARCESFIHKSALEIEINCKDRVGLVLDIRRNAKESNKGSRDLNLGPKQVEEGQGIQIPLWIPKPYQYSPYRGGNTRYRKHNPDTKCGSSCPGRHNTGSQHSRFNRPNASYLY